MARGKWTMSIKDRAQAQYQADQIAAATGSAREAVYREGWEAGYRAGYEAGAATTT